MMVQSKMQEENKMEITYTEKNGILYPDLQVPVQTHYYIGKYGSMRLTFIK